MSACLARPPIRNHQEAGCPKRTACRIPHPAVVDLAGGRSRPSSQCSARRPVFETTASGVELDEERRLRLSWSEVRGQRSEVRSQKSEVRSQRSEVRSQKSQYTSS